MGFDMEKEVIEGQEIIGDKVAEDASEAEKKIEETVVSGYQKIEDTVVGGYKKIEDTVVGGYKKIEETVVGGFNKMADGFVSKFFAKEGETAEEAKVRMMRETEERQAAMAEQVNKRCEQQEKLVVDSLARSAAIIEEAAKNIGK